MCWYLRSARRTPNDHYVGRARLWKFRNFYRNDESRALLFPVSSAADAALSNSQVNWIFLLTSYKWGGWNEPTKLSTCAETGGSITIRANFLSLRRNRCIPFICTMKVVLSRNRFCVKIKLRMRVIWEIKIRFPPSFPSAPTLGPLSFSLRRVTQAIATKSDQNGEKLILQYCKGRRRRAWRLEWIRSDERFVISVRGVFWMCKIDKSSIWINSKVVGEEKKVKLEFSIE